jgi:hypothetical protein
MSGPVPEDVWSAEPRPDAVVYRMVWDPDLGCLVEATAADGSVSYGADPPRA